MLSLDVVISHKIVFLSLEKYRDGGWWYSGEDASLLFRVLDPRCHRLIFVVVYPC